MLIEVNMLSEVTLQLKPENRQVTTEHPNTLVDLQTSSEILRCYKLQQ